MLIDSERILADYPAREFRKANPLAFCANELNSLGEETIRSIFNARLGFSEGR